MRLINPSDPGPAPESAISRRRLRTTPARTAALVLAAAAIGAPWIDADARVIFEITSPYHHIRVIDEGGIRTLSFDGSMETRMSLRNPLLGHFEYIDYFHMPWLWNAEIENVLMLGLGGGSIQRAYQHYYPETQVDTVEIDPAVLKVARAYFQVRETPRHRVHLMDGRLYLRTQEKKYDVIIVDAYVKNRYGSFIPYHLATQEFFELARDRLGTNGVLAYNVMGTLQGWRADILAAVHQTMKSVFPNVYLFPASDSMNVVVLASRSDQKMTVEELRRRAAALVRSRPILPPGFQGRIQSFRVLPAAKAGAAPLLTDDFAPIDGLLSRGR